MSVPYDVFTVAFLGKVSEYELMKLENGTRTSTVDGYMKRAINAFKKVCKYDLSDCDDALRVFPVEIDASDLYEISDIISEGMVVQWLKPYVYQQELLQNVLNTQDFNQYSPAELLMRVGNAYEKAQRDYTQMIREYSYNHANLGELHL